jgi:hypothetical protein
MIAMGGIISEMSAEQNIHIVIAIVIILSILPAVFEAMCHRKQKLCAAPTNAPAAGNSKSLPGWTCKEGMLQVI